VFRGQKSLGKAVLITFWGDLCQEYCRLCQDPQFVSWCPATPQTYAKSDSRVSQKGKHTKTEQMRGQIWKFAFQIWSQMWKDFVQSNKRHYSPWKLQMCRIFHFKLHFSYSWNAIFKFALNNVLILHPRVMCAYYFYSLFLASYSRTLGVR